MIFGCHARTRTKFPEIPSARMVIFILEEENSEICFCSASIGRQRSFGVFQSGVKIGKKMEREIEINVNKFSDSET